LILVTFLYDCDEAGRIGYWAGDLIDGNSLDVLRQNRIERLRCER
jgi:hypothetical protein